MAETRFETQGAVLLAPGDDLLAYTEAGDVKLDLRLRHGKSGQVLPELRREEARERAAVPLRQVRLAARRSGASAEILPGMRRFVRRE